MTAAAALAGLRAAGVRVRLGDDGGVALDADGPPPADVLAMARRHRAGIVSLLQQSPDVPATWREGVARLATLPAPDGIPPPRWAALAATSDRMLRDHGAELHRAGWDAPDLFGLHSAAPVGNPTGWGLAWLLGSTGEVLDVSADMIGMCREPGGVRLGFRRRVAIERAGTVPTWALKPARAC